VVVTQPAWLFLAPAFSRSHLASLKTFVDSDGVCRQSDGYTCVPASAVTVLRKLGLPAEEGELAILAHTSRSGTMLDVMCDVLQKKYRAQGLVCECKYFDSIDDLNRDGYTLAATKFSF